MKYIVLLILTLSSLSIFSQEYNGEYISFETSFRDYNNDKKSFREKTKFIIEISINIDRGYVSIEDIRIPDRILVYRITESKIQMNNLTVYENSVALHTKENEDNTIVIYRDNDNLINLMIDGNGSSQLFKNLQNM